MVRSSAVDVTVIVPTMGRPEQLRRCLASLCSCDPRPEQILVVDQSGMEAVAAVVRAHAGHGVELERSHGVGMAEGTNTGARAARHDRLLRTDDDCTVRPDWAGRAAGLLQEAPDTMYTGRVLARTAPERVPSLIADGERRDYFGEPVVGKLFAGNMAVSRSAFLGIGGFDQRFALSSEDNDLCWRWLSAGRRLVYEPELVVWHEDWRTPQQLEALYVRYARGQGHFYAKHLLAGDRRVLPFLRRELRWGAAGLRARATTGRPRWSDWRQGILRGTPMGLLEGLRLFSADFSWPRAR